MVKILGTGGGGNAGTDGGGDPGTGGGGDGEDPGTGGGKGGFDKRGERNGQTEGGFSFDFVIETVSPVPSEGDPVSY